MATTCTRPRWEVKAARRAMRASLPPPWRPTRGAPKAEMGAAGVGGGVGVGEGAPDALEALEGSGRLTACPASSRALGEVREAVRERLAPGLAAAAAGGSKRRGEPGGASESAATPGSSLPSRSSRVAPPPVLTCESFASAPNLATRVAVSPPPMTVVPPRCVASTAASSTALDPPAKRSNSKTPMGPFHTSSAARRTTAAKSSAVRGPMSSPIQPAGMPAPSSAAPTAASAWKRSAVT
mmetsp:Transcript_20605/g.60868  ORF Transcript_20605/g.60868 Transcript_20605/m.60868 type:complete len:239 (-) Transcript_20605:433-1149(-)